MCLGVPGRVIGMVDGSGGQLAVVDLAGSRRRVNVGILDSPPDPGDWLVIHVGFALERMDDATVRDALACFDLPQLQETSEERSQ
ncbi:HypC/HybG/HupF family hydrogenase formation chaperone [soil metagenome]